MSLVDLETFKKYLRNELGDVDDETLQGSLDAADECFEIGCSDKRRYRRFRLASAPSARLYVPRADGVVRIMDCTTVTAVSNFDIAVSLGSCQLEPLNAIADGRPIEQIRLIDSWWTVLDQRATVTITATWGWPVIPATIVEATKVLAKDIASNRDVRNGIVGMSEAGAASARENQFVRRALQNFRRLEARKLGGFA